MSVCLRDALGQTVLHHACTGGHLSIATGLARQVGVGAQDDQGRTPLMLAAAHGHVEVFTALRSLDGTDDIERADNTGKTMLAHAICSGSERMMDTVLAAGAKMDPIAMYEAKSTLLHYACQHGIATMAVKLLDMGAGPYVRNSFYNTPLVLAAGAGHAPCVEAVAAHLIVKKVKPPYAFRTPVHEAAKGGRVHILKLLESLHNDDHFSMKPCFSMYVRDDGGYGDDRGLGCTPLMFACKHGRAEAIQYFIQRDPDLTSKSIAAEWPLLHWCCAMGYTEAVRVLLTVVPDVGRPWMEQHHVPPLRPFNSDGEAKGPFVNVAVSALGTAIIRGQAGPTQVLVDCGADVVRVSAEGHTALAVAVALNQLDIVKLLLSRPDMDINGLDRTNVRPVLAAISAGHQELTAFLLGHPGVHASPQGAAGGQNALHRACIVDTPGHIITALLARSDVDVNARDNGGKTGLMHAAKRGHVGTAKLLLAAPGVDIEAKDNGGMTAICYSMCQPKQELVRLLLDAGAVVIPNAAVPPGPGKDGTIPPEAYSSPILNVAAYEGNALAVETLIAAGADVDAQDLTGVTALMEACYSPPSNRAVLVDMLLASGHASPNIAAKNDTTAVWRAVYTANVDVLKALLSHGAVMDVHKRDHENETLLHLAIMQHDDCTPELVNVLLAAGADATVPMYGGSSLLFHATQCCSAEVVGCLLDACGVDVNAVYSKFSRCTPLMAAVRDCKPAIALRLLQHPKVDVSIRDAQGHTPLSWTLDPSAHMPYSHEGVDTPVATEVIVRLIERSTLADINGHYDRERTLLHFAARFKSPVILQRLLAVEGIDVDARCDYRHTPLMFAAGTGQAACVQALLDYPGGVDVGLVNKGGQNALMVACADEEHRSESAAIIRLLSEGAPPAILNQRDTEGHTAYTLLCNTKSRVTGPLEALLEADGVDTTVKVDGKTGLQLACMPGNFDLVDFLADHDAVPPLPAPAHPNQEAQRVQQLATVLKALVKASTLDVHQPEVQAVIQRMAEVRPVTEEDIMDLPGVEEAGFADATVRRNGDDDPTARLPNSDNRGPWTGRHALGGCSACRCRGPIPTAVPGHSIHPTAVPSTAWPPITTTPAATGHHFDTPRPGHPSPPHLLHPPGQGEGRSQSGSGCRQRWGSFGHKHRPDPAGPAAAGRAQGTP